uniref:Chlorophyllase n=1 Tax=Chromera velia CCMP2878 TaxID=1169474 RepID=A0A0G4H4L4_9ALVE|eukprot:Cvel_845.t1-p1 / transcript=Cvel_845.t1 / gene=Cvel_845 / organism=Chromera_velia_CCMP2878 / gene_product=hypothetical protein / transcript_product=hypothetical protein / location=Cvel_scaffold26:108071-111918(+) / protein_length=607 / sequence_SO=supercontig / SO=protein_coding / is_pseudo=false
MSEPHLPPVGRPRSRRRRLGSLLMICTVSATSSFSPADSGLGCRQQLCMGRRRDGAVRQKSWLERTAGRGTKTPRESLHHLPSSFREGIAPGGSEARGRRQTLSSIGSCLCAVAMGVASPFACGVGDPALARASAVGATGGGGSGRRIAVMSGGFKVPASQYMSYMGFLSDLGFDCAVIADSRDSNNAQTGREGAQLVFQEVLRRWDWPGPLPSGGSSVESMELVNWERAVAPSLLNVPVAPPRSPGEGVLFLGHSRGGKLAVLAAETALQKGIPVLGIVLIDPVDHFSPFEVYDSSACALDDLRKDACGLSRVPLLIFSFPFPPLKETRGAVTDDLCAPKYSSGEAFLVSAQIGRGIPPSDVHLFSQDDDVHEFRSLEGCPVRRFLPHHQLEASLPPFSSSSSRSSSSSPSSSSPSPSSSSRPPPPSTSFSSSLSSRLPGVSSATKQKKQLLLQSTWGGSSENGERGGGCTSPSPSMRVTETVPLDAFGDRWTEKGWAGLQGGAPIFYLRVQGGGHLQVVDNRQKLGFLNICHVGFNSDEAIREKLRETISRFLRRNLTPTVFADHTGTPGKVPSTETGRDGVSGASLKHGWSEKITSSDSLVIPA